MRLEIPRIRAAHHARLDVLDTQAGAKHRRGRILEGSDEFSDGAVMLREVRRPVLAFADPSLLHEIGPDGVEGVEHTDAAGVAEIAPFLVDPEVEETKPAARHELAGAGEKHGLPVAGALLGKGPPLPFIRTHHVNMSGDLAW